jgi:hypothetical protein
VIGFREYIDYAEKHLAIAEEEIEGGKSGEPYLVPAIILAWSAIESFVNNRLDEFDSLPSTLFEMHEKAFLTEQILTFENSGEHAGKFTIKGSAYRKLSDKILFLIAKCGSQVNKGQPPWQDFERLKDVRDALVHPRLDKHRVIDADVARDCFTSSKKVIVLISDGLGHKVEF